MSTSAPIGSVGAVVVTYDPGPTHLEAAVASVQSQLTDGRIVVVDHGGFAAERLETAGLNDARTSVVETASNPGFAAGVNVGRAALGDVDAMAVVHDDVVVGPGWLEALVRVLDARPSCGGVQPIVADAVGGIDDAGYDIDPFGAASRRDLEPAAANLGVVGQPDGTADVAAISLVASLIRTACFDSVGGVDERYTTFYDDVDLCRRARRMGWTFAVAPGTRAVHRRSSTLGRVGFPLEVMIERNRLWSTARNGSTAELARALGLSLRRLRHQPRAAHRRALVAAASGLARRRLERWRALPPVPRTDPDPLARRTIDGVNVVGYHHVTSGLGAVAREFSACLRAAGVDVIDIDNDLSDSPIRRDPAGLADTETPHDVTVAFVTAFEFPYFRHRFERLRGADQRMIGYWFWELDTIPAQHREAFGATDEVWAATRFVRNAYRAAAPPGHFVRRAPLRLPTPEAPEEATQRWRDRLGAPFTFLVSFDYLSVPERKHPEAAVEAFQRAFTTDEAASDAVSLVIKTINADARPEHAATISAAAGGDERIRFVDEHLADDDHHGLLAAADCYVSPHRSEGLGLHVALAMWLRTPVVATRYGGVIDICDDETAWLVDHDLVGVVDGGGVYPTGAPWADIDIDGLIAAMRAVRDDPDERHRRVGRAHRRIADQPSRAEFGRSYVDLLTTSTPSPRIER